MDTHLKSQQDESLMQQHLFFIALSQASGLDLIQKHVLLNAFDSWSDMLKAWQQKSIETSDENEMDVSKNIAHILDKLEPLNMSAALRSFKVHQEQNCWVICYTDVDYPNRLKQINDAPFVLYGKGQKDALKHQATLAIVGSRKCSKYGQSVTSYLSKQLAEAGLCIVSGLAEGIDSFAHWGSVASNAPTVAVLGHGLKYTYPKHNQDLSHKILDKGCLLSEFPYTQMPEPKQFPRRNRIVAGLSQGVLVVQGAHRSGASITARLAVDYNRDVYAVPGPIMDSMSALPHRLLKQGAKICTHAQDILEDYNVNVDLQTQDLFNINKQAIGEKSNEVSAQNKERFLKSLQHLNQQQTSIVENLFDLKQSRQGMDEEALLLATQIKAADLMNDLFVLSDQGLIERKHDGKWQLCYKR